MARSSQTSPSPKLPSSPPSQSPSTSVLSLCLPSSCSPFFQLTSALKTIVFSVPSPVPALRYANLAINTLLLLAVAEFLLVPYFDDASGVVFTRVGALYPDAAKIVVRYPPTTNATENLVRLSWRQLDKKGSTDAPWREGPLANLTAQSDWVGIVRLPGLWPSTTYECMSVTSIRTIPPYSYSCNQTGSKISTTPSSHTLQSPSASAPSPTLVSTVAPTSVSLLHRA